MVPRGSDRRRKRKAVSTTTTMTKSKGKRATQQYKNKKQTPQISESEQTHSAVINISSPSKQAQTKISNEDSSKSNDVNRIDFDSHVDISNSACSTPKAERYRIPEINTCPPAPRKRRIMSSCSLRRNPIAFFAPPDIELFFFFALGDISV